MTVEHTPTTDEIRAYYVWSLSRAVSRERGIGFDRWLAAHDAEVAAVARQTADERNDTMTHFECYQVGPDGRERRVYVSDWRPPGTLIPNRPTSGTEDED